MGRFYKAPDPDFIKPEDFLYKAPWEEIKAGIKYQDEKIEGIQKSHQEHLTTLANLRRNTKDPTERALYDAKYQKYAGKLNEITDAIAADPLSWRNYIGTMNAVGTTLKEDMMRGDLFYMQKREDARKEFEAAYKGKMNPKWYNKILENRMDKVGKSLSEGDFTAQFDDSAVYDQKDIAKDFMEYASKMEPNVVSVNQAGESGIFLKQSNGTITEMPKERIEKLFNSYVNSEDMRSYLQFAQGEQLMNNVIDENGNAITVGGDLEPIKEFVKNAASYRKEDIKTDVQYTKAYEAQVDINTHAAKAAIDEAAAIRQHNREAGPTSGNIDIAPDTDSLVNYTPTEKTGMRDRLYLEMRKMDGASRGAFYSEAYKFLTANGAKIVDGKDLQTKVRNMGLDAYSKVLFNSSKSLMAKPGAENSARALTLQRYAADAETVVTNKINRSVRDSASRLGVDYGTAVKNNEAMYNRWNYDNLRNARVIVRTVDNAGGQSRIITKLNGKKAFKTLGEIGSVSAEGAEGAKKPFTKDGYGIDFKSLRVDRDVTRVGQNKNKIFINGYVLDENGKSVQVVYEIDPLDHSPNAN